MPTANAAKKKKRSWRRRLVHIGLCLFGVCVCLVAGLLVWMGVYLNGTPVSANPVASAEIPTVKSRMGGGLDGFDSPYIGHTGSWNGKGGAFFGGSKAGAMDQEVAMGLRWTFMCVYWSKLEPDAPVVDLSIPPEPWRELDSFVIAAHERRLNILMQAPVVGGNAGGPPEWAGRREAGKSAPMNMQAAADFAGRLAERYAPGGTIASEQGWGTSFGVRAWELDNEPESYRTNWGGQAGDYAEFVTLVSGAIRQHDPEAVILAPACAGGGHAGEWIGQSLDATELHGSPDYVAAGQSFSIGPAINAVSFHVYEGLDSLFAGKPRNIEIVYAEQQKLFDAWAATAAEFQPPNQYWHTEGNYDFLGVTSSKRRAAWRWQFFTRAFSAGVNKVCVMDASTAEQAAIKQYVEHLPAPFPMRNAAGEVRLVTGEAVAFVHDDPAPDRDSAGRVWIAWATPGVEAAEIEIPTNNDTVLLVDTTGHSKTLQATDGWITLHLPADKAVSPSLMVVDR